jgi:hypothetical protein
MQRDDTATGFSNTPAVRAIPPLAITQKRHVASESMQRTANREPRTASRGLATVLREPMLGDESGLTDTMWDLIVDTIGASAIARPRWRHSVSKQRSLIDDGV